MHNFEPYNVLLAIATNIPDCFCAPGSYLIYKHSIFFLNICMHVCVYIMHTYNKYTQYTHIYYVNKNFILDAINCLSALVCNDSLAVESSS